MNFFERERPRESMSDRRIAEARKFDLRFGISEVLDLHQNDIRTAQLYIAQKINRNAISRMERLLREPIFSTQFYSVVTETLDVPDRLNDEREAQRELNNLLIEQKNHYPTNQHKWFQIGEAVKDILSQAEEKKLRLRTRRLYRQLAEEWKKILNP